MDWLFTVILGCLAIITIIIYVCNLNFNLNKSLLHTYKKILIDNPSAITFCLGFDNKTKTYKNVYAAENEKLIVKYEEEAIDLHGNFIFKNNHGKITDLPNGYTVNGFQIDFKCPEGFIGPNCQNVPICSENEKNIFKPLYKKQFMQIHSDLHLANDSENMHPRLKIQCFENGAYKLIPCKSNEMLDANLKCVPYDYCVDENDGYKHNFPINANDKPLSETEYFLCVNKQSKLTKCPEDTVFSNSAKTCVTKSQCFGHDNDQIQLDANNYIQCSNDEGKKIYCKHGIIKIDNHLKCKQVECEPKIYKYSDNVIQYVYGKRTCDENNKPVEIICNNDFVEKKIDLEWGEKFEYKFQHWPKEILSNDEKNCTTDVINNKFSFVEKPKDKFKWSQFMKRQHSFNPQTLQFECDTEYKWDYFNNKIIPSIDENIYYVDSSEPCQKEKKFKSMEPWFSMKYITFPEQKTPMIYGVENYFEQKCNWPLYVKATKSYIGCTFNYNLIQRFIIQLTFLSKEPPYGFESVDFKSNLNEVTELTLIGYPQFHVENQKIIQNYSWWFANTSIISPLQFKNSHAPIETKYPLPTNINTKLIKEPITFCIIWSYIVTPIIIFQNELEIYSHGIKIKNVLYKSSLSPLTLKPKSDSNLITLLFQNLSIEFTHFEINLP